MNSQTDIYISIMITNNLNLFLMCSIYDELSCALARCFLYRPRLFCFLYVISVVVVVVVVVV